MKRSRGLFFHFFLVVGSIYGHGRDQAHEEEITAHAALRAKQTEKEIAGLRARQIEAEKSLAVYMVACEAANDEAGMITAWNTLVNRGGAWEQYNAAYGRITMLGIGIPSDIIAKQDELYRQVVDTKIIEVRFRTARRLAQQAKRAQA